MEGRRRKRRGEGKGGGIKKREKVASYPGLRGLGTRLREKGEKN